MGAQNEVPGAAGPGHETKSRLVLEIGLELVEEMAEGFRARSRMNSHHAMVMELRGQTGEAAKFDAEAEGDFREAEALSAVLAAARKGATP